MGCLKLSYYEREEGLEQSTVFFRVDQSKKGGQQKNRQDYYPYGLTFNEYKRPGLDKNEYLYQGKEEMEGTDWYDFHARSYHAGLGRFMSVDPVYNGPSGFVGMANNPVSTIDPDGETPLVAVAIAAAVSAVSYTASIALSDGGFNNWDWGQFGENVFIGAASGAITFGIGEYFKTVAEVGKLTTTTADILKTATHATFQGGLSAAQGGDFLTAFASGAVGGIVGLGTEGLSGTGGDLATIGSSMLLGGATAEATGGEFWKGAAISGIVAGANHVAHRAAATPEERLARKIRRAQRRANRQQSGGRPDLGYVGNEIRSRAGSDFSKDLFERYWLGKGDARLSNERFLEIWDEIYRVDPKVFSKRGRKITMEDGSKVYARTVNFYGSDEYALALGRATVFFDATSNLPVGFYDYYDFDPKDWGVRSNSAEIKTRMVHTAGKAYGATPFRLVYGVVPSKYLK
ncbi:MAG: RHS repeat-associated core domain-containing protein [Fulvivirga sp.]